MGSQGSTTPRATIIGTGAGGLAAAAWFASRGASGGPILVRSPGPGRGPGRRLTTRSADGHPWPHEATLPA